MQFNHPFNKLSKSARVTLQFIVACKALYFFEYKYFIKSLYSKETDQYKKTYIWLQDCLKDCFSWLSIKNMNGENFYDKKYTQYVDYMMEDDAFNSCICGIAFVSYSMLEYDIKQGIYTRKTFPPSDLAFTGNIYDSTLQYAQQASDNPEAEKTWQDKIIARLLKDHHTEDPDDFGENISREYIEELLGEKLPF